MALNSNNNVRKVGALGNILFEIAEGAALTFRDLKFSASGNYTQHELIGRKNIVEVVGRKPSDVTFEMTISEYLGVSVKETLNSLRSLMENGYAVPLVIGNEPIGDYRWVLNSYSVTGEYYSKDGKLTSAKVSVNLLEYPQREATML